MGGSAEYRAKKARIQQAKNLIDEFLATAKKNKQLSSYSNNFVASLINATKNQNRKKVLQLDNSAKSEYIAAPETLQKYSEMRKAIINLTPKELNKYFQDEYNTYS